MNSATTDSHLVTSYLAGDRSALAAMYDRYAPGLYDTARAMLSNTHDASDIVHDVFCLAAERLGQLRDPDRLKPWLYAVLRNEVYKRTKRRRRATPTDFQSEGTPEVPAAYDPNAAGESVAYEELASLVRSASAGLDERDRLVLELSVRQGLSGADLADALGVSTDQSYSLVHRMRDRVEKSLGALTVAKAGRRDCPELDLILRGWDGEFTVLVRKRVNRHIEDCPTCDGNRRKLAPLALFGAAPAFALPSGLRDRVLASVGPTSPPNASGSSATRRWTRRGFPAAQRSVSIWIIGGITSVLVTGGAVVLATRDDTAVRFDGPVPTAVATTSAANTEPNPAEPSASNPPTGNGDTPITSVAMSPVTVTMVGTSTTAPTMAPGSTIPSPVVTTSIAATTPAPTTTAPRSTSIRSLVVSSSNLDFGTTATSLTLTVSNPNGVPVDLEVGFTSSVFTVSGVPSSLGAGKSVRLTVTFDRATTESYAQIGAFPEGRFDKSLTITSSTSSSPSSTSSNQVTLTGVITRPPVVGKVAAQFSGSGCTTVRVQAAVTDESTLKGVTATVTIAGSTRSVSMTLVSGSTYAGTVSGSTGGTAPVSIVVTASDATGRTNSASISLPQPTSC